MKSALSKPLPAPLPPLWAWWHAIRPKTLSLAFTPVVVGTALAWAEAGALRPLPFLAALLAAVLIQIGTNLHNDATDFARGADTPDRLGPKRATAEGWLTARQVLRGVWVSLGAAFLLGIYLAWVGGWPIVAVGLLSLLCAVAYTGGPRPIAYSVFGEAFVFLFFGICAVAGSYYLQTLRIPAPPLVAGAMLGTLAAAVLMVNNYRDLETDRRVHKITLAAAIGRRPSQALYAFLLLLPFALLPTLFAGREAPFAWLPFLLFPWALRLTQRFRRLAPGPEFNTILAQTAQFQLLFGLLVSLALLL